jgi:dihydrofolate reductase
MSIMRRLWPSRLAEQRVIKGARRDVADEVAGLKNRPGAGIVSAGGARLAASLAGKDLIEEYRLFVSPVVLGGGTPYFPSLPKRLDLELIETQTFLAGRLPPVPAG